MLLRMVSWNEVEKAEPEFAAKVRRLFDAHKHKTIATLRADGSPRISGIEADVRRRRADVRVDAPRPQGGRPAPRPAVRAAQRDQRSTGRDSAAWPGEAKIAGRAYFAQALDGADEPEGELFRADVDEVVVTRLNAEGTMLLVESWRPGRGLRRAERA